MGNVTRIDEIYVQAVATTYNETGELIKKEVSQPVSYLRGVTKDVWSDLDTQLAETLKQMNDEGKNTNSKKSKK